MAWRDELDALKREALQWHETTKGMSLSPEAQRVCDPLATAFASGDRRNVQGALTDIRGAARDAASAGRHLGLPSPPSRKLYGWHVMLSVGAYDEERLHWHLSMSLGPTVPIGSTDKWRDRMVKHLGADDDDLIVVPDDPRNAYHWVWIYLPS